MGLCRKYSGPECDEEESPATTARGQRQGLPTPVHCDRCNCNVWNPEQHRRWHRYADA
jgi:hypothetical protein